MQICQMVSHDSVHTRSIDDLFLLFKYIVFEKRDKRENKPVILFALVILVLIIQNYSKFLFFYTN